jgi:lactate 2-monooxygenase
VAGEAGVREVIENVVAELDLSLGLTGHDSVGELGPQALATAG